MAISPFDHDAALLACAQGDERAFQTLYRHEAPHMLALALKMLGQRAAAEELVRDAFVLIWKNADGYDKQMSTGRAWMYSILRYRALGRLRQSGGSAAGNSRWADPLPDLDKQAGQGGLVGAIAGLDESQRKPLLMAFYNGCTYEQMSARLNIPGTRIRAQLQAGLGQIAERHPA